MTSASGSSSGTRQAWRATVSGTPGSCPRLHRLECGEQVRRDHLEQWSWGQRFGDWGRTEVQRLCGLDQPRELAPDDRCDLVRVEPGLPGAPHCGRGVRDGGAVRQVAGVEDPTRRDQAEQGEQVCGGPPGGVEEEVGSVAHVAPEPPEVGQRAMCQHQAEPWPPCAEVERLVSGSVTFRSGVDDHREPPVVGDLIDVAEPGIVDLEPVAREVELDPTSAG
jgi:hypothetical protein